MKMTYHLKMIFSTTIMMIIIIFINSCQTVQISNNKNRNPKCEDVKAFKVFQVLDDFVLANVCENDETSYCMGHVVLFKKEKGKIYFDDQIIAVKDNECAIYTGTYKYKTQTGYKTVPIVEFINSEMPNTEPAEKK